MPEARHCQTMAEVRCEIDRIDREIVALIAERMGFIDAAARIKPARALVRDEARKADVLARVAAEARRLGVPETLARAVYEQLVEQSIAHEFDTFDATRQDQISA